MIYNIKSNPKKAGPLEFYTDTSLNEVVSQSEFRRLDAEDTILLEFGGYVILGELQNLVN